jgi:nucleotide-binding universal stress UspA family protein
MPWHGLCRALSARMLLLGPPASGCDLDNSGKENEMDLSGSYRTLLLSTDASPQSERAGEHAMRMARDFGARLYVLFVIDAPTARWLDVLSLSLFTTDIDQEIEAEGKQAVEEAVRRAREAGIDAEGMIARGSPGEQICRFAQEHGVGVIFMGAAGKSNLEHVLLGSVSGYVIDHSNLPVLVLGRQRGRD